MFASIGAAGGHLPLLQAELPEQKGKSGQLLVFPPPYYIKGFHFFNFYDYFFLLYILNLKLVLLKI